MDINPLSDIQLAKSFSHPVGSLFNIFTDCCVEALGFYEVPLVSYWPQFPGK